MNLRIQLFANLKERFGQDTLTIDLSPPVTVQNLLESLKQVYPTGAHDLNSVLVAKNKRLASPTETLEPTDEIALIPPVGGGEDTSSQSSDRIKLSNSSLMVEDAYRLLEDVNHGGTVIFAGTVREWTRGRQTSHLTYESYEAMAIEQMTQIQHEVEGEFEGVTTLQWHRVGKLNPPDIAVICGASSPHRDNAFLACRRLIERLKSEVAIWKLEYFTDGNSTWQANAKSTNPPPDKP